MDRTTHSAEHQCAKRKTMEVLMVGASREEKEEIEIRFLISCY